jgi:hypothetical protein
MPDIETWIDFDADVTVQSFAAREIDMRAARFGVYRPGVFDFADGTVQGWSLDQLYDSSDPTLTPLKAFPAPPGGPGAAAFTLSNSQNRALAASASLLLADPTVKQLDFYFQSPDLSKREGWDKAGGYRIDLRREFFSKCLDKPELFAIQLQAQFWDLEASKLRTYAEYDDATGKFLFHPVSLATPQQVEWRADAFEDKSLQLRVLRVRCTQPNFASALGGECLASGRWLIGNVAPLPFA